MHSRVSPPFLPEAIPCPVTDDPNPPLPNQTFPPPDLPLNLSSVHDELLRPRPVLRLPPCPGQCQDAPRPTALLIRPFPVILLSATVYLAGRPGKSFRRISPLPLFPKTLCCLYPLPFPGPVAFRLRHLLFQAVMPHTCLPYSPPTNPSKFRVQIAGKPSQECLIPVGFKQNPRTRAPHCALCRLYS